MRRRRERERRNFHLTRSRRLSNRIYNKFEKRITRTLESLFLLDESKAKHDKSTRKKKGNARVFCDFARRL
jgi:hypothetical protein